MEMSLSKNENENQLCVLIKDNKYNKDNENIKIKRCIAYNKNNNRCRAKIKNNEFFCCDAHKPLNYDLIDCCFICLNKIENVNELYYFRCKHIMHKECYDEWINYSNYNNHICMICRNEVFKMPEKKNKIRRSGVLNKCDYNKLHHIFNTFNYIQSFHINKAPISYTSTGNPIYDVEAFNI